MEALLARVDARTVPMDRSIESRQPYDHGMSRNCGSPPSQSLGEHPYISRPGNQTTRRLAGHSRRGGPPTLPHLVGRLYTHDPRKIPTDSGDPPSAGR
ncbi:hypothetical protein CRG98_049628 [Punica granatum]|uniref:Uncharacterized protein n=1 Tax=Punica granatum TaxID=22663 RepID=A0A2I0H959_PUNGR|nr:hypothetical protein CRG98_049628 [Punica granatum]